MSKVTFTEEAIYQVAHDLRAPVTTMHGSVGELGIAVADLVELLDEHRNELPDEFFDAVNELVQEDLSPCLEYLRQVARRFEKRIEEVPKVLLADGLITEVAGS